MTCRDVLNSMLSSYHTDKERAGNVPFVVVRQAVAVTKDMGVGHAGLVKLCRFMGMDPIHHKSYVPFVVVRQAVDEGHGCGPCGSCETMSFYGHGSNTPQIICKTHASRDSCQHEGGE